MRPILLILLAILCGCATTGSTTSSKKPVPLTREARPRHDQQNWLKEREAINNVVAFVEYAKYASRRPQALRDYALYIRVTYAHVSMGGNDVDAGVRALNYIHKIHLECGGSGKLWKDVLDLSRIMVNDSRGQPIGLEPPLDYK